MLERQRNDMLTLFSHDMRAPLTSLIILIDTQARRSGDGQMKQQFARIGKLARHTLALADGFAQLSRAEASDYERVPVNLADLMNEARDAVCRSRTGNPCRSTTCRGATRSCKATRRCCRAR